MGLWKDARGSAAWDIVKLGANWLRVAAGSLLTAAAQIIHGWAVGHQNASALVISFVVTALFIAVALIIGRGNRAKPRTVVSPRQVLPVNSETLPPNKIHEMPDDAPVPTIVYALTPNGERLRVTNDGKSTLQALVMEKVTWQEARDLNLFSGVMPLSPGHTQEVRFQMVQPIGGSDVKRLTDVMKEPTDPNAKTIVLATFSDQFGRNFQREFELRRFASDGSIVWNPGPTRRL